MNHFLSPTLLCDFYKLSHRAMYPKGTETVYSTWTPRGSRIPGVDHVVAFGMQMAVSKLAATFHEHFFEAPKWQAVAQYERVVKHALGDQNPDVSHIEALWDLGYLPIEIQAVPEGTLVPLRVPYLTIWNTRPEFYWLTNYLETFLSCELWLPATAATLAHEYRKVLDQYALETTGSTDGVQFQGHDFSMRGMSSLDSAISSGLGHLLSFVGTDTIPAIQAAEHYYGACVSDELVGTSIPATEHSVQCAYGNDLDYFERIVNEVHPTGLVSIVADGYDFWNVIGNVLPFLKDRIMAREGKVVIRPDSGDPVKIVCGDWNSMDPLVSKGAIEVLWDTFGGTINDKGYKELDSHIGLIYGDAITLERAEEILMRLQAKGFASTNVVFGIGSFTYQYNTRDTFGFAMKSTMCTIDGVEKPIFKAPKTDDGTKNSQRGCIVVVRREGRLELVQDLSFNEATSRYNCLRTIFCNGVSVRNDTLANIRSRLFHARSP